MAVWGMAAAPASSNDSRTAGVAMVVRVFI
jgi:hypothetical protein